MISIFTITSWSKTEALPFILGAGMVFISEDKDLAP